MVKKTVHTGGGMLRCTFSICLCTLSTYSFHSKTKNRFAMVHYVGSTNRMPRNPLACRPAKPINISYKVLRSRFELYVTMFLLYSISTKRGGLGNIDTH